MIFMSSQLGLELSLPLARTRGNVRLEIVMGDADGLAVSGLCVLTFVIHLIGTLAYAVRIAGVRTRRIAVSFALFNVLVLVSRTSNSFQGPFLAKRIEAALRDGIRTTSCPTFVGSCSRQLRQRSPV